MVANCCSYLLKVVVVYGNYLLTKMIDERRYSYGFSLNKKNLEMGFLGIL